ncbi:HD domain-containing protein [Treponema zuelzerae]|uniref:HD domain-containing protein n=1 Tax=Teretinema zuelzerae TaxID=156 RepID=A0AAE3EG52_9SPIR|nr:HD domain-containing protein [Teretinema zuelzerae]MBN2812154.1 HD domain-containing protein [Spirochaetales bacterium]MCD1654039.1 HD domain-containing protein [Teretinema zuelzerae]
MEKIEYQGNPGLMKKIEFIMEADKIKSILRKSRLFDDSRCENDAEHSWTIALMAYLFREYANAEVDIERVMFMLLIHDIVEVDAGDTFLYAAARADAHEKERKSAERVFGILDSSQRDFCLAVWEEFEARETPEAQFASVFDRFEPLLQNYATKGHTWKQFGITADRVLEMNRHIAAGSAEIWAFLEWLINDSVRRGYLAPAAAQQ